MLTISYFCFFDLYPISRFFISFFFNRSRSKSTSFIHLRRSVRTLISKALKDVYSELNPVTWDIYDPTIQTLDSGISGILDKLTCIESTIFIRPSLECSGVESQYLKEIISGRNNNGLSKETTLEWGISGPKSAS